jgi:flagellar basal body-associated protein FliL
MYGGAPPPGRSTATGSSGKKKLLVIGIIAVAALLLLGTAGFVAFKVLGSSNNFAVGSCVKQEGSRAKQVDCDDDGAFTVVSKETKREDCADQAQPFVLIERDGKNEVLCLSPKQ